MSDLSPSQRHGVLGDPRDVGRSVSGAPPPTNIGVGLRRGGSQLVGDVAGDDEGLTTEGNDDATLDPFGAHWPNWITHSVDVLLLAAIFVQLLATLLESQGAIREVSAVLALGVAPGWSVLRALRVPGRMFTLVAAFSLSVAVSTLSGLILVTRLDWMWQAGVLVIEDLSALCLVLAISRWLRSMA